jgi:chemosensory pili system protein ChpA (sensor histidine kinase/response regulator)
MKKILIIEDDRMIALAMFARLKAHGYEVITACEAADGVRLCLEHLPDLVILDICLRGASGFDVAARIRNMPPMAGKPIIFMTGSRAPKFPSKAAELGAAAFLVKPFNDGELIAAVRQALGDEENAPGFVGSLSEPCLRRGDPEAGSERGRRKGKRE